MQYYNITINKTNLMAESQILEFNREINISLMTDTKSTDGLYLIKNMFSSPSLKLLILTIVCYC